MNLAGIHRIQRVPASEKRGRRHSSTVSVVALPDQDSAGGVRIGPGDVRTDTYRSTGAGGQHRNKTDSAVRLTHRPTGIVVTATEQRSQHQNRSVAWARLRAELVQRADQHVADEVNDRRAATLQAPRTFIWTQWRDQVKYPGGTCSYRTALRGKIGPLLD